MENTDTLEKIIIKSAFFSKDYLTLIALVFQQDYFDDPTAGSIFNIMKNHVIEFNNIIPRDTLIVNESLDKKEVKSFFDEIDSIDFDVVKNYEYLLTTTNTFLKEKAMKKAILNSVSIINSKDNFAQIKQLVEDALCKDIRIDLGLDYFGDLKERIRKILTNADIRIPTYYPQFDEFINGGFPPYTLSIITAAIHGWKSAMVANITARQVIHGHNVVVATFEMSQDAYAQRFDAIYSNIDINKMYRNKETLVKAVLPKLKEIKDNEKTGKLFIKQFPTGRGTIQDVTRYCRELKMRGTPAHVIYVDYMNLMKPSYKERSDSLYSDVKGIVEELRAMSFEFEVPVISPTQLNREGQQISFDEVDFTYTQESISIPATADFQMIFGIDKERAIYESEIQYKIVKNRLGGRVGEVNKFFYDARTLKMYDSEEMGIWIDDAQATGDERAIVEVKEDQHRGQTIKKKRR